MAKFVFYPDFDENIKKASNKSKSSLRPLFDKVRNVTDEIYQDAYERIAREAGQAEARVQAAKPNRFKQPDGKLAYDTYRAIAFALKSAKHTIAPTMEYDGKEIHGRVAIYRKDSASLEFGGTDSTAEVGRGSGRYINHPAYAFLRKAMDGVGS